MLVQLPLGLEGGRAGGAIQLDGTVAIAMPFNQVGKLQSLSTSTLAEEGEQGGIAEGKDNEINEHKTIYSTSGITPSCDASNGHLCLPPCRNCHTLPWPPPCLGHLLVMRLEVPRKMLLIAPFQALRANTDLLSRGEVHLQNFSWFC